MKVPSQRKKIRKPSPGWPGDSAPFCCGASNGRWRRTSPQSWNRSPSANSHLTSAPSISRSSRPAARKCWPPSAPK
ncbi:MAG: hypothetical protein EBY24_22855, partial [Betaproteobacteria bacterium]|nr:hypothetical protein [Betaproteobacteria bacterium]